MDREEAKARRKRLRNEEQAVRKILNDWGPLGGSAPDDEYDCLVHHLMSVLHRGGTILDVKSTIQGELTNHFGLSDVPKDEVNQVINEIWVWWTKQESK